MALRKLGGAVEGGVVIPAYPSSALKTTLDAARLAGTAVEGMLLKFTWLANNQVAQAATGEPFDAVLESAIPDNYDGYILSIRALRFSDSSGNRHPVHSVGEYSYTGSPSLQDPVVVDTAAMMTVAPATTYGDGAILAIDTTNTEVLVLMD